MKFYIKLDIRESQKRKLGFPVAVFLSHKGLAKKVNLGFFSNKSEWDFKNELPLNNKKVALIILRKKIFLENLSLDILSGKNYSLQQIRDLLMGESYSSDTTSFYEFYQIYLNELQKKEKFGSYNIYKTALDQLKKYRTDLNFTEIDYSLLKGYKDWRIKLGNSKNTIHTYLRKYRAVYNEAVKRNITEDRKPFADAFKGITVKHNRTKKKNISKEAILCLETAKGLNFADRRTVDLFLLIFYFGGQDLKDIYFLERKNINNNRIYFTRGKLDETGYQFDLQITPKAQKIINRHQVKGKYLFGWRKDFAGYKTFRDNFRRSLLRVQKKLEIQVLPLGGNLGIKVARHTFATFGKNLFIDTDLLRELMGHERNDVDTIYKDKYPENVRDEAHFKIIE